MASLKLAIIALLAFGAVQCQSANVYEPEPRDLDVSLTVQNAIKIVRNVITAVEKGIKESQPSIDILIQQLTPELGKAVKKVIDDALVLLKREKERIEFMIEEVQGLHDAIKKIKSCTDPEKKDLEKVLGKFENGVLDAARATLKNHSRPLELLKTGFYRLLNLSRKLFDEEIKNVIGCIKPGHPNAQKCIEGEADKIKSNVIILGTKIMLFADEVNTALTAVALEMFARVKPLSETLKKDINPVMKNISDCIAKMK